MHWPVGNSLFRSLYSKNITRFQNIQNCLARFVSGASRFFHVTPILKSLTGSLLNNESFSQPCYSDTSTLPLASQKTLPQICLHIHLPLKKDVVIQKRCFLKSPSIFPQFINLKFISISPSPMMLRNSGMICHWKFKLLMHYHVFKGDLKLICFRSLSLHRFSHYQTPMIIW